MKSFRCLGRGTMIFKVSVDRLYDDCMEFTDQGKNDAAAACMCVPRGTTTQKWCWPTLSCSWWVIKALAINSLLLPLAVLKECLRNEPSDYWKNLGENELPLVWLVSLVSHCGLPLVSQIETEWTSSCSCIVFSYSIPPTPITPHGGSMVLCS